MCNIDVLIIVVITFFISVSLTTFVMLLMTASGTKSHEEDAYKVGYEKGFKDGEKAGKVDVNI